MFNVTIEKDGKSYVYFHLTREQVHELASHIGDGDLWVCNEAVGIYWDYRDCPCF